MSSTLGGFAASNVIDADVANYAVSQQNPASGTYNWISVQISSSTYIGDIVVTARGDNYYYLLNDFEVYAGESAGDSDPATAVQCGVESSAAGKSSAVTVSCGGVTGKAFVTIKKTGIGYLSLAGISIYTYPVLVPPLPSPPPSPLPSPPSPLPAGEAVTITTSFVAAGDVADIKESDLTTLKLVLAAEAGIDISAISVTVEPASVRYIIAITVPSETATMINQALEGGALASGEALEAVLAEQGLPLSIEDISEFTITAAVASSPPLSPPPAPPILVTALGSELSSTYIEAYGAGNAIDGDAATVVVTNKEPTSGSYNWVSVQVDPLTLLGGVSVLNRADAPSNTLLGSIKVYAGTSAGDLAVQCASQSGSMDSVTTSGQGVGPFDFWCDSATGYAWVTVTKVATGYMSLAEVTVYAAAPAPPLPPPPPPPPPPPIAGVALPVSTRISQLAPSPKAAS